MSALVGQRVGGYVIERMLGEGGMGSVWLAQNPITGALAAVKVIKHELVSDAQSAERFLREAIAGSKVRHPNIVQIYDVAPLPDGRPYILMEYLEGGDLEKYLQSFGKLGADDALRIVGPIASALEALHEVGVVHRDLKPENVILTGGEARLVKVVDFGLAKVVVPGRTRLTHAGIVAGTLGYMAPDQASAFAHTDARADIYSLGMIAIRMVAGRLPFIRDTPDDNLFAILERARENPDEARWLLQTEAGHLPPGWFEPILRSITYRPEQRYQHARELPLALAAVTEDGERTLRAVAPRFWSHAPPDAETVKNRRDQIPTEMLTKPPPAAPASAATPTTLGGAAMSVPAAPPAGGNRVLVAGAVAGLVATATVAVLLATRGGRAAPDPERDQPRATEPPAAVRDVWVVTEPLRATVYADGRPVGESPVRVSGTAGAWLTIRAEMDGHEPAEQRVQLDGGTEAVTLTLVALVAPDAGAPDAPSRDAAADRTPTRGDSKRHAPDAGAERSAPDGGAARRDPPPRFDPNAPLGPQ